jgi:hypothetical protein
MENGQKGELWISQCQHCEPHAKEVPEIITRHIFLEGSHEQLFIGLIFVHLCRHTYFKSIALMPHRF